MCLGTYKGPNPSDIVYLVYFKPCYKAVEVYEGYPDV